MLNAYQALDEPSQKAYSYKLKAFGFFAPRIPYATLAGHRASGMLTLCCIKCTDHWEREQDGRG